jgi:hypothetical protein
MVFASGFPADGVKRRDSDVPINCAGTTPRERLAASLGQPLERPSSVIVTFSNVDSGAKTMSEINWDEQVQVYIFEPVGIKNYRVVEESVIRWDRIGLAEAIRRCMRLSANERARVSICASSGHYNGRKIESLYHRLRE